MFGRGFESLRLHKLTPDSQLVTDIPDNIRTIMPRYKLVKSYDAGGDITKEWFVQYHFLKPVELRKPNKPLYGRFKVGKTINSIHTVKERKKQLKIVHTALKDLLDQGFSPYYEYKYSSYSDYGEYNIMICIDRYLEKVKPDLKPNTYGVYEDRLGLFKQHLEIIGLEHIGISDVSKQLVFDFVKKYQVDRHWSNKTFNHYLQALNTFFQYYIDNFDHYLKDNPCGKIKKLQVMKKGNAPFNNTTFREVLSWTKTHNFELYQFCRFVYYSCLRPDAELRFLKIDHIDLVSRRLMVPSGNAKSKTTQWVPIDDQFAEIIVSMNLHRFPRHFYVFGKYGKPGPEPCYESYFRKQFLRVRKVITINKGVTLYSFKHTRCIHLYEDGEKLHNIIKLTRHKTLAELMDYLKDMGVIIGDSINLKSRTI